MNIKTYKLYFDGRQKNGIYFLSETELITEGLAERFSANFTPPLDGHCGFKPRIIL